MKQDNRCSAIILAHDVFALDLPIAGALTSIFSFADEVVLVVPRCEDETLAWAEGIRSEAPVTVVHAPTLPMDHRVPERVWRMGAEAARFPWLCQWDLAWGLHEDYGPWVKDMMSMPTFKLVSLDFHELYGTPGWYVQNSKIKRRCLIGHRSTGFRIETTEPQPFVGRSWIMWADLDTPLGGNRRVDADEWDGREKARLEVPVIDFWMARQAQAVAVNDTLWQHMLSDTPAYADWHLPEVEAFEFDMQTRVRSGMLAPYDWGEIPKSFQPWCARHQAEWAELDMQAQIALEGRLL